MAVIIPLEVIKDIAQTLETGMKCWYHIPTGEVLSAPDRMRYNDIDEEIWKDTFNEIDEKMHDCIAFDTPDSKEEFRIMASFAEEEVTDIAVSTRLVQALNQRKPFMHFKAAINFESDYLKAWYAFKTQCYMDRVQDTIDYYNSKEDEKEK